jgi:hypothetical protein
MGHHWSGDCSRGVCIVHVEYIFDISFLLRGQIDANPDISEGTKDAQRRKGHG